MTKEELRRIELMAMPPIKKAKEPSIKEKLHFCSYVIECNSNVAVVFEEEQAEA